MKLLIFINGDKANTITTETIGIAGQTKEELSSNISMAIQSCIKNSIPLEATDIHGNKFVIAPGILNMSLTKIID